MEELPEGTKFNHANRDGVWGGAGQSGHSGEAIWMASENDLNAAHGYAGSSGRYFVVEADKSLKLAVMDEPYDQVEPDELGAWAAMAQEHGLDGVKTEHESSYEVVLFDRSKIRFLAERPLGLPAEEGAGIVPEKGDDLGKTWREMEVSTSSTAEASKLRSRFGGMWSMWDFGRVVGESWDHGSQSAPDALIGALNRLGELPKPFQPTNLYIRGWPYTAHFGGGGREATPNNSMGLVITLVLRLEGG
ncbi:hypothetical protein Q3C01_42900 [Bradyrhizobium sp. UFLA05-109]